MTKSAIFKAIAKKYDIEFVEYHLNTCTDDKLNKLLRQPQNPKEKS